MVPKGGGQRAPRRSGSVSAPAAAETLSPGPPDPSPGPGRPRRAWGEPGVRWGRGRLHLHPSRDGNRAHPAEPGRRGQAGTAVPPTPSPEPPPRLFSNTSPGDWQEQHVMCLLIRVSGGERASGRAGEGAGRGAEAGAGATAGVPGSPAPRPPPSLWEKRRRGSDCGVDELCTSRNAILIPFPEQVCISPRSLPEAHRSPRQDAWEPGALPRRKYAPGAPALRARVAARCPGPSGSDLPKNFWGWGG